jgi:phosphonatase-like hydrolase
MFNKLMFNKSILNKSILNKSILNKSILNKSIKLLICDMAGTTVNEGGIVYKTLYKTIKDYGIYIEENEIEKWHGANKTEVLNHFIKRDPESAINDAILPILVDRFNKNLKESYQSDNNISLIHPHLPFFFNSLRESGVKIALNTGYSRDIQECLIDSLNMNEFIDGYISSEDVPEGRPHPYMILKLMKQFNITKSNQVVKVGDTVNDMLEGKVAKCYKTIGVLSGADSEHKLIESGADLVLDNIMELDKYCDFKRNCEKNIKLKF